MCVCACVRAGDHRGASVEQAEALPLRPDGPRVVPGQVVRLERSSASTAMLGMPQLEGSGAAGGSQTPPDRAPQPSPVPGLGLLKGLF
jgi:hypothetical protein